MNVHRFLIHGYRIATMPLRWTILKRAKRTGTVPVGILFYHRVDDHDLSPWTITNKRFAEHVDWLQANFDLVSIEEAQNRIRSGFNTRPTISITFDDGYADNCTDALPMLIKRGIPVTYFVTAHHTIENEPFPHDLELKKPQRANTVEVLRSLHKAGVEIGSHSKTHVDLGPIADPKKLFDEVVGGTRELEKAVGCRIRYFAFPFGQPENLNPDVFQMCHDYGFQAVVSAYGGWNEIGDDSFHLQRFHGEPRISYLKNWLTLDPRKRKIPRYPYELKTKSDVPENLPAGVFMPGPASIISNPVTPSE
jgi:peptidoglycan/xylan/chitin deacetylase (PgdA/CDA1 family)